MKRSLFNVTAMLGIAVFALAAHAGQDAGGKGMDMANMKMDAPATNTVLTEGEVKAIDKARNSVTLKHGHIKSKTVEMAPMTMSFPVEKPALLAHLKVGDKVKFTVENVKGTPTVTKLQSQK